MTPRIYAGFVVLVTVLVVIAVLGGRGGLTSSTNPLPPEQGVNRIAFVGLDGQVRSMNPDGSEVRQISSGEGFFTWPTWSPDARRLVYSGVVRDGRGNPRISLLAFNAASGSTHEIYAGEPGIAGLLADGVVHYPLWSPDSRSLAFIAVTSRGLTLFVDTLEDGGDADLVLDQGPLWMSWSPDSRYLLVHRGADHFLVSTLDGIGVTKLHIRAIGYRVPAWKPQGVTVTLASANGPGRYTIFTADVVAGDLDVLEPITYLREIGFRLNPAFLWSPSGEFLALAGSSRVINYLGLNLLVYRDLVLVSEDRADEQILIQDNVIAYFWSSDGAKLAYVMPSDTPGILRWMILNVADGKRWPLVDFIPSRDQLTMFQFFDQYAYSHSLWSPDSQSLVFAGRLSTGAVAASWGRERGAQGSHIIVLSVGPHPSPASIAEGILGFWSPR